MHFIEKEEHASSVAIRILKVISDLIVFFAIEIYRSNNYTPTKFHETKQKTFSRAQDNLGHNNSIRKKLSSRV